MAALLQLRTRVLPGNKIEIQSPSLSVGDVVDVTVTPTGAIAGKPSILDFVESLKPNRVFQTPQAVDQYIKEERDSWER